MAKEFGSSRDLVTIKEIKEDTLVLKDGGLRQVLMVSGVNFALKSEMEQNLILQAYQNLLNTLDFPIQIIVHSRKVNIEKYLEKLDKFQAAESSPILKNQAEEYREFISGFVAKNPIMEKSFFVVVPFFPTALPSATSVRNFLPFFKEKNAKEKQEHETATSFAGDVEQLRERVKSVAENLSSIGLESMVLNNEQLTELLYNFYNPETVEKEKVLLGE